MIHVSEKAAKHISRVKEDENNGLELLRVKVVKGGCSGFNYKLDFDNNTIPTDKVFEEHGVKIIADPDSYLYLIGMTLDYEGGLNGQGFVFKNPNATATCSCGSSFNVK